MQERRALADWVVNDVPPPGSDKRRLEARLHPSSCGSLLYGTPYSYALLQDLTVHDFLNISIAHLHSPLPFVLLGAYGRPLTARACQVKELTHLHPEHRGPQASCSGNLTVTARHLDSSRDPRTLNSAPATGKCRVNTKQRTVPSLNRPHLLLPSISTRDIAHASPQQASTHRRPRDPLRALTSIYGFCTLSRLKCQSSE
jgi:hypothetical protein